MNSVQYLNNLHKEYYNKYGPKSKEYLEFCKFYDEVTKMFKKKSYV